MRRDWSVYDVHESTKPDTAGCWIVLNERGVIDYAFKTVELLAVHLRGIARRHPGADDFWRHRGFSPDLGWSLAVTLDLPKDLPPMLGASVSRLTDDRMNVKHHALWSTVEVLAAQEMVKTLLGAESVNMAHGHLALHAAVAA